MLRSMGLLHQDEGQLGQALLLQGLGELALDKAPGREFLGEALRLSRELGNQFAEARALWSLGGLDHAGGRLQEAEHCLHVALRIWQARTLDRLGVVQADSGRSAAAQTAWRQALVLFEQVGAPEAQAVAQRLPRQSPADLRSNGHGG